MAADLLTLNEYTQATGTSVAELDTDKSAQISWAITTASECVRQYVDRDLTLATDANQADRTFRYYGHNVIEIDDCTAVTQVQTASTPWSPSSRILDATEWIAGATSSNLPVLDYIELWTNLPFAQDPAMGFKQNQDMYGWRPHPVELTVSANWGWPSIPRGVQMAAIWTIGEIMSDPTPYAIESIANYSRTVMPRISGGGAGAGAGGGMSSSFMQEIIPERARSALDPYIRVNV